MRGRHAWSADGQSLLVASGLPVRGRLDVGVLSMEGNGVVEPLVNSAANEGAAVMSPDGQWFAYRSDESGQAEVYVERFSSRGDRRQVSAAGGRNPVWPPDGTRLFYRRPADGAMMTVAIRTEPRLTLAQPQVVFEGPYRHHPTSRQYDVSPDGQRFLMTKEIPSADDQPAPWQIIYVQNWFEELKQIARVD